MKAQLSPAPARSILVTGGAGEIGARLVRRLSGAGHRVRALLLPDDPGAHRLDGIEGVERHVGDITRPSSLQQAFCGIETVYHLAAVLLVEDEALFEQVNVAGTANVAQAAAAAGVHHLIHVSSASVVYPKTTPYSRSKRAGELAARQAAASVEPAMHLTIVRPTLVYDGKGGLEFALFLQHLERFPIVAQVGAGEALKNPVHVVDLLDGLQALADPIAYGKTYNLSGGEVLSMRELTQLLLAHRGLKKTIVPIPLPLCRLAAAVAGLLLRRPMLMQHTLAGLTQDAALPPDLAMRELGYAPRGIRKGLRASAEVTR